MPAPAWIALAGKLVYLGGGWLLAFVTGRWFIDQATGRADIVAGMQTASWGVAALILALGVLPAVFVKERYYAVATARRAWLTEEQVLNTGSWWK